MLKTIFSGQERLDIVKDFFKLLRAGAATTRGWRTSRGSRWSGAASPKCRSGLFLKTPLSLDFITRYVPHCILMYRTHLRESTSGWPFSRAVQFSPENIPRSEVWIRISVSRKSQRRFQINSEAQSFDHSY